MPTQGLHGNPLARWDMWRPRCGARLANTERCVSVSTRAPAICKRRGGKRQHLSVNFGRLHSELDSESRAVNIAIGSNVLIFGAKVWVSSNSGSSALFAEAVHTLADIGNQLLLRFGIARSTKAPTKEYPCASPLSLLLLVGRTCCAPKARQYEVITEQRCRYGYMKEKFIFSLISAVGVFCIGAGASVINGAYALADQGNAAVIV